MRSYCRIKGQIGDWARTVLPARPADEARQHARARRAAVDCVVQFTGS
jgi:hypothetical protein